MSGPHRTIYANFPKTINRHTHHGYPMNARFCHSTILHSAQYCYSSQSPSTALDLVSEYHRPITFTPADFSAEPLTQYTLYLDQIATSAVDMYMFLGRLDLFPTSRFTDFLEIMAERIQLIGAHGVEVGMNPVNAMRQLRFMPCLVEGLKDMLRGHEKELLNAGLVRGLTYTVPVVMKVPPRVVPDVVGGAKGAVGGAGGAAASGNQVSAENWLGSGNSGVPATPNVFSSNAQFAAPPSPVDVEMLDVPEEIEDYGMEWEETT